ncbi:MAG: FG-GAP-like repeat-containing protein [Polyangiaceae bacterium]|nr:FG-GAP-like repeat-containing protein [Polyangiaceae bacterium]
MTPSSALAPWLLCAALLAAISCLIVPARAADDKSGVSPSRLHLPKGPGSLEGIGENAEPNLSMGLMTYGVPIEVPKGYDGLAPALRLAYSSGSGNSEVGIGWSLSVPSVERMTSKGLPRYAVTDTFAANGGDELVRLGNSSVYRARYEGGFVRYTWRNSGDGKQGFWTAEYPDGRIGTFGARADGASDESALVRGPLGVFRYHLSEMTDRLGHSVRYEYAKDGSVSLPHRISYGFQGPGNTLPRYVVLFAYEERPDAISDARPGIDVRLSRRLTSIQVLVRGAQLRRYVLSYRAPTARTFLSRLERVAQFGLLDKGPYPIDFRFSYTGEAEPNCSGPSCDSPTLVDVSGELGLDFATGQADLTDINGDGLPDVLDTSQAKHRFFVNTLDAQGRPSFGSPVASSVGSLSLTAPDVQTVDIDGDGFSDLVKTDVGNGAARVLWNKGAGQWHADAIVNGLGLPNFSQASNLRFVDYNGDKRIDLLFSDGASSFVYENTPGPSGSPRFQHRVLENLGVALSAAGHRAGRLPSEPWLGQLVRMARDGQPARGRRCGRKARGHQRRRALGCRARAGR